LDLVVISGTEALYRQTWYTPAVPHCSACFNAWVAIQHCLFGARVTCH